MKTSIPTSTRSLKYLQLASQFRKQMESGALKPGDQLPSFAQMQAEHGIGQGTLERVYAVLEEEKLIVRQPKRGTFVTQRKKRLRLNVIGVALTSALRQHPYYLQLLQGIQEVAYREHIELLLLHDGSEVKWERMDGIIVVHNSTRLPPTMPAICLVVPVQDMPCIMADEYNGVKAATEHLIKLGHRKIAFLTLTGATKPEQYIPQQRLQGYRDALQSAGIEPTRRWTRRLMEAWDSPKSFADLGYEKMCRWLEEDWTRSGYTAVLAHNDDTAIGVMRALREAGIKVPEQVSVMGFDGTEISEHVRPALSTVVVPLRDIGAAGMEFLIQEVYNSLEAPRSDTGPAIMRVLETQLEVRESTTTCNAK